MNLDKDSLNLDLKDVDSASVDTLTVGIDSIAQDCDFSELVDSIYNDKIHLFSSTLPDSPPDSGSEHLLSPQSTTNSTYSMTSNQLDASSYNNQYMDSSPATTFSAIAMSPPSSLVHPVLVDNDVMYPSTIHNPNSSLTSPFEKDNNVTTHYVNGPVVRNTNISILKKGEYRIQTASSPTISHENVYPDLRNVDYDMPRQIMEGHITRKGSLPLYPNNKVTIRGSPNATNVQSIDGKFLTQYSLTENETAKGYIPISIIKDDIAIEDKEGMRNLGFSNDSDNMSHVSIAMPNARKRKIDVPSDSDSPIQILTDKVKIENEFMAISPSEGMFQHTQANLISSTGTTRRNVSGGRDSVCSEAGFLSPLHQPCANKTGQSIRFSEFDRERWGQLVSQGRMEVLSPPDMEVNADKGFNFSSSDNNFIVQKKNHFQLSIQIRMRDPNEVLQFVKLPDGYQDNIETARQSTANRSIEHIQLNFYGIKTDSPSTKINIEQSQGDRKKTEFFPLVLGSDFTSCGMNTSEVPLQRSKSTKLFKASVGRLHFAETTCNNMRKKGKPNPAQKYFQLVVSLDAVIKSPIIGQATSSGLQTVPLVQMMSERIIVRASNPGQFDNLESVSESTGGSGPWCKDAASGTIYHLGNVGINTNQASEALSVQGNIQMTGALLQPSDLRIKKVIRELDSGDQLENVKKLKIVQYQYKPEYLNHNRRIGPEDDQVSWEAPTPRTGVIAQDVAKVLPDAVYTSRKGQNPFIMENGELIDDVMIVDKDRLFLENIGAVHQLSKISGDLGDRIDDLEKANESVAIRLSRLKRGLSINSSASDSSSVNSSVKSTIRKAIVKHHSRRSNKCSSFGASSAASAKTLFQNRCVQTIVLLLVAAIAVSVVSMASLYMIEYQNRQSDTNENVFQDPLLDVQSDHGNKDYDKIRKDSTNNGSDERTHKYPELTTIITRQSNKTDKTSNEPADDASGQREVIPSNNVNDHTEEKKDDVTEHNTQKKNIRMKADNKDSVAILAKLAEITSFPSVVTSSKSGSSTTNINYATETFTTTMDTHHSTFQINLENNADHNNVQNDNDKKELVRYENGEGITATSMDIKKPITTPRISLHRTVGIYDIIQSGSIDDKHDNETDVSINLLHSDDEDQSNIMTTEEIPGPGKYDGKRVKSKGHIEHEIPKESKDTSLDEGVANITTSPNEINERHRSNVEPANSQQRSTISPYNNIIDDDYREKHQSSESEDMESGHKIIPGPSGGRNNGIGKKPRLYNVPSKDNIAIRELTPNNYELKDEENKDNENHLLHQQQDWNKTTVVEGHNSEKLHEMATKSNSDNEVEEAGFGVRENVSIHTLINEELYKQNDFDNANYSNETRKQNHETDNAEKENSVSEESNRSKEIPVADYLEVFEKDNTTNYDTLDDEPYLNEVVDKVSKEPVSKINQQADVAQTKRKNSSDNEERNVVTHDKRVRLVSPDNNDAKDNENRTEYTILPNIASDDRQINATADSIDVQILESNTIEPEKELKLRKPFSSLEEKKNYDEERNNDDSKTVKEGSGKDRTHIADLLPDYHDEENNLIVEEKNSFNLKSQPLSKLKETPVIIVTSTSHPLTSNGKDRILSTTVTATNTSLQKSSATTTRELLNEVENESLSRSDLEEHNIMNINRGLKDSQKISTAINNQSNAQSSRRRKLNLEIKKPQNEAIYDDDKMNELGKDPIPVLLKQRAKRSNNKDIISNFILFMKRLL